MRRLAERRLRSKVGWQVWHLAFRDPHNGEDVQAAARLTLQDDEAFEGLIERLVAERASQAEGPIADIFQALLDAFLENPEFWIGLIIKILIGM